MKLAFVSQSYPPDPTTGGIGTQTWLKAQGMAARGHDVWVLACGRRRYPEEWRDGRVRVLRLPAPPWDFAEHERWLRWSETVSRALHDLHARERLSLVDFAEYGGEGYHFARRPTVPPLPITVQIHGPLAMLSETIDWPPRDSELLRVGLEMEGTLVRAADLVYSSSALSADWVADAHGVDRAAIEVLHVGVDLQRFRPGLAERAERPTVLFVGALSESKGVFVLLDAVLRAAERIPELRVRMLGNGSARTVDQLRHQAELAGRPEVLELPGYVDHDELPKQLCRGNILVLPSRYEGGPGLVLLEAMACGLPVIACTGSGAAEAVVPGATGLLVPPGDAGPLTEAIVSMLEDPDRHAAMSAHALAHARSDASSVPRLDRLEQLLLAVAARAEAPR